MFIRKAKRMKNNLNHLRCYFAHPIEFANKLENNNIELHTKQIVEYLTKKNVEAIEPEKVIALGINEVENREQLFNDHNFKEIRRQMKIIVRKDLRSVDISDFIIAYLPKGVRTTGTIHEIIQCDAQRKPTLIICPDGIQHIPAWLFGIIPLRYMFGSINDLFQYLYSIDQSDLCKIEDDRWQFIISALRSNQGL